MEKRSGTGENYCKICGKDKNINEFTKAGLQENICNTCASKTSEQKKSILQQRNAVNIFVYSQGELNSKEEIPFQKLASMNALILKEIQSEQDKEAIEDTMFPVFTYSELPPEYKEYIKAIISEHIWYLIATKKIFPEKQDIKDLYQMIDRDIDTELYPAVFLIDSDLTTLYQKAYRGIQAEYKQTQKIPEDIKTDWDTLPGD